MSRYWSSVLASVFALVTLAYVGCSSSSVSSLCSAAAGCRPSPPPPPLKCSVSCTYSLLGRTAVPIPAAVGFSGTFNLTSNDASAGSSITLTSYVSQPAGGPAPLIRVRRGISTQGETEVTGTGVGSTIFWVSATYSAAVIFNGFPSSSWIIPASSGVSGPLELETFDGTSGALLDLEIATPTGGALLFPGNTTTFTPVPGHTYWYELIADLPPLANRLYISDGIATKVNPGTIKAYAWPSRVLINPSATLAGNWGPRGMAFDAAQRLFIANSGFGFVPHNPVVQVFTQPILDGAMPAFELRPPVGSGCTRPPYSICDAGEISDVAVDAAGNVAVAELEGCYVCGWWYRQIGLFEAPISNSSSQICTLGYATGNYPAWVGYTGMAYDHNNSLWAGRTDGYLDKYQNPTCKTSPSFSLHEWAADVKFDSTGNMYVARGVFPVSGPDNIDVYKPPFGPSMTKAFSINVLLPRYLAFDRRGNLLVNSAGSNVVVFTPPLTSASKPVLTLPISVWGFAIGP